MEREDRASDELYEAEATLERDSQEWIEVTSRIEEACARRNEIEDEINRVERQIDSLNNGGVDEDV